MNDITIRFLEVYNYLLEQKQVLSPSHFARIIEISSSMMNEILKGRSNAGINPIQNTVKIFEEISAEWLLTGKGNKLKSLENVNMVNDIQEIYAKEEKIINGLKSQIYYQDQIIEGLQRENKLLWKIVDGENGNNGDNGKKSLG